MEEHPFRTTRTARYYTLGHPGAGVTDLWIVCHGYGQLAREFLAGLEPIASPTRVIAAPEALSRFYAGSPDARKPGARVGASWMTREDRLAEIEDQVAYLDGLAGALLARLPDGARLRALGFSQGASAACRWAALGTSHPTDLILWAGEIPDLPDALMRDRLSGTRVHLVAGTRDKLVPEALFEHQVARLRKAGLDPQVHRFDGGHRLDSGVLRAMIEAP